jgi:class 3 adenylate cyclase/tetratricopeptide (TPR) repeat protein
MPRAPRAGPRCAACGRALRPSHRFCSYCGTPVDAAQSRPVPPPAASVGPSLQVAPGPRVDLSENRRLVSILFADLSGSTQLGERLDAEDLRLFLSGYFSACSRQIQRFGGTVDKYIGDAIMAAFGAPVAHEDDAERAINAALAMHAAFAQLNDKLERDHGVRSGLRIGINTGEVVAGLLTDTVTGAYTVVGDTVNTAQRFESAAPAGATLVGESTWRLTRRAFEFEALPPLELKGKSEPQAAYLVVKRSAAEVDVTTTPLVGRTDELQALNEAMERASSEGGRLVHLVGEAGVGKSRLLREFRAGVDPRVEQVVARCASFEVDSPYALVDRLLRARLQIAPGVSEAVARNSIESVLAAAQASLDSRDIELLLEVLGYGERSTFDPQSKQRVLLRLLRRLLLPRTKTDRLLLVAEDLHWSDSASSDLLLELSRDIQSGSALLISTSRPDWAPPWSAEVIALQALPEEGARTLVESAFGQPVSDELAQTVLTRAGGNPFFIEEVARGLFESDALKEQDGRLTVAAGRTVRVPATIQEVVGAHLDRLELSAKRTLQPAAVVGRVFAEPVVQRVVGNGSLATNLATLQQERLIVPEREAERTYGFRHALIQEVAYQNQLQSQRRVYHAAVGEALEVLYPDRLDELIGELAFHYSHSDDNLKGLEWQVRAGDRARRLFANQEALSYYRWAVDRARDGEGPLEAGSILERIGDIDTLIGRYDDAIATFGAARGRIPTVRPNTLARLQRKTGTALRIKGAYAEAEQTLGEARNALGGATDIEAAQVGLQIGQLYWRTGDYAAAREALTEAVDIASTLSDDEVLAEGLKQLGNVPLMSGDPNEAVAYYRRSEEIYQRLEDIAGIAMVRLNLGTAFGRLGRWEDCLAEFSASLQQFERIGDQWHIGVVYNNMGELYRERRDFSLSIDAFERALSISKEVGYASGIANALTGLGSARVESGAVEEGRSNLLEAAERFRVLGRSMYMPHIHRFLASAELAAGNLDLAAQHATQSLEYARAASARHEEAMTERVLAEIAFSRGDRDQARRLLEASRQTLAEVGEAAELERADELLRQLDSP